MKVYISQIIFSLATILIVVVARTIIKVLVRKFAKANRKIENRTNHIIRVCNITVNILGVITIIGIWGVSRQNLMLVLSSIFAIIGVAFFAQWSLLSNVTAGIILYFASPFKIGDTIQILDKDEPELLTIEDIHAFYTHLRTEKGELQTYPNSLLLQKGIQIK